MKWIHTTMSLLAVGALIMTSTPAAAGGAKWQVDQAHSEIGFSVRHLGLSTVRGQFGEYSGTFKVDAETGRLQKLEGVAKTTSVDTRNERRDNHLRSDDFFDAENHPDLKLRIDSFEWKDKNFKADAKLTIRGTTRTVPVTGKLIGMHKVDFGNGPQKRAGYELTATIDRHDFGVDFSGVAEGIGIVGDEVDIEIALELFRPLEDNAG